jgi:iron complex transport system permease protein
LAFLISMNTGIIRLSPLDVVKTLVGNGTDRQELILFDFRLPRIMISLLMGIGLAVSGCILQGLTRNALADPGILGINSGAGLTVILFVSFYPDNEAVPVFLIPFLALIGAGSTAVLIYVMAYNKRDGLTPLRLVLSGIGISAGIVSATLVLSIRLDPADYQFVSTWLAGSIWGTSWKYVLALLPWLLIWLPVSFFKARVLNILHLEENTAIGLGIQVNRERFILLFAAVALAGACVAVGGSIGFVGLIAPHLARRLVGPKHEYLLPASALTGALLVIVSDTLARSVVEQTEIPTGIVVAILGAPYFLYLLAKSKA